MRRYKNARSCCKNDKPLRSDIRKAINNLGKTCKTKNIESIAIIRDLALIPLIEWAYFKELYNEIWKGSEINLALLQNNIPISCAVERYKIITEYHETTVGGHRELNKTYNKIAKDFYWKNMTPRIK
jgi:hypothetical protein